MRGVRVWSGCAAPSRTAEDMMIRWGRDCRLTPAHDTPAPPLCRPGPLLGRADVSRWQAGLSGGVEAFGESPFGSPCLDPRGTELGAFRVGVRTTPFRSASC